MQLFEYLNTNFNQHFESNESIGIPVYQSTFSRHDIITDFGEVEQKVYFLQRGLVQSIIKDSKQKPKIIDFIFKNIFFCAYTSFLSQQPSIVQIKAIEDCKVQYIHYKDLEEKYRSSLFHNQLGRTLTAHFFIRKAEREIAFLTLSAKERYLDLLEKDQQILQKIPIKHIAQYLGIHPESLSRIRREISNS